jgi:hypothetical protein
VFSDWKDRDGFTDKRALMRTCGFFSPFVSGEHDMLKRLWLDEGGAILSAELLLIMVILVIGITVGMVALRDAVVGQYGDVAGAIAAIYPAYEWAGLSYESSGQSAFFIGEGGIGDGISYAWVAPSGWATDATANGAIATDAAYGANDVFGGMYGDDVKDSIGVNYYQP